MGFSPTLEQRLEFINEIAPLSQNAYKTLGKVLPSVCIGMACIESGFGYGTDGSRLMYKHNAILGQKVGKGKTATQYWGGKFWTSKTKEEYQVGVHSVITAAFRGYDNLQQCILNYYELLNTSLYKKVASGVDYATQMKQIKACGYMTSSTEVNSVIQTIKTYNLTKFDEIVPNNVKISQNNVVNYRIGDTYTLLSDLYIRINPGGTKAKYESITLDAKQHGHFDDYGCAILDKGTRVTCKDVVELESSTWLKIPSGYICAKNKTSTYIK